eukprot:256477_1
MPSPDDEASFAQNIEQSVGEMESCIRSNNIRSAMRVIVEQAPAGCKNESLRARFSEKAVEVLFAIPDDQIAGYVSDMQPDEVDTLLKYVYKGFESGTNSKGMLSFHKACTERNGLGGIVRAFTDKRVV